jgi:hypothetical protein
MVIKSEQYIKEFQARIETDGRDFCEELFQYATIRLLAFKYGYYVLSEEIVKDATYDAEEKVWHIMGQALGHLKEDETSPCVDFDASHPLAAEGKALAEKLLHIHDT